MDKISKDGMEHIAFVMDRKRREDVAYIPPTQVVSTFGIVAEDGQEHMVAFVLSPMRDGKHGIIGKTGKLSKYSQHMLDSMFKHW